MSAIKPSLAYRFTIPILLSSVLFFSLLLLITLMTSKAFIREQMQVRASEIAESFTMAIETERTHAKVVRIANSIGSYRDVTLVLVLRQSQEQVVASNLNRFNHASIEDALSELKIPRAFALAEKTHFSEREAGIYHFAYPLYIQWEVDQSPELLTLYLWLDSHQQEDQTTYYLLLLTFAVMFGVMTLIVWIYHVLRRRVLHPIRELNATIAQYRPDMMTSPESVGQPEGQRDEMSQLVVAYQALMRRIDIEQAALVKEKERSESASQAKSEFLAMMTHEVRTPLNGIVGCLDLIQATDLEDDQQQYLKSAHTATDHLMGIVNDVLDMSKIEAGKMTLELDRVDLVALVGDVVDMFNTTVAKRKVQIEFANRVVTLGEVEVDSVRLKQVLVNLLSNACKFTEEGRIVVQLSSPNPSASPNQNPSLNHNITPKPSHQQRRLELSVTDTGIGIAREQQSAIFEHFTQADSSSTRKYEGAGLGLTISAQLVRLMGGELKLQSQVGQGSCFYFQFRCREFSHDPQPHLETPVPTLMDQRLRALIVDDTKLNLLVADKMLSKRGFVTDTASSGRQALDKVQLNQYDVILMDCLMPEMSGYECTRMVREIQTSPICIVGFSASALQETEQKCFEAGMDHFLTKPINQENLDKICQFVEAWQHQH